MCPYPLTYTIPRKTLRISGAPRSKFSKPYQLPKTPWGTKTDNSFVSLDAVPDASGKKQDLSQETLAKDSSLPFFIRFHGSGEISDDLIRQYIHHQNHNIRFVAANKALGINSAYIGWRSLGGKVRMDLVMEFLNSKSPRVRRAMFSAIYEILQREKRNEVLTREIFDLAIQAVKSPEEAWSVKDPALQVIGYAPADWVVPHVCLLLPILKYDEWWLQNTTMTALTPVVADERCYQKVLPAIGELIRTNQRSALTLGLMGSIRAKIKTAANPEVHKLAVATLKESYTEYAGVKTAEGGQDITKTLDSHLEYIAASLADVPGGLDVLYEIARQRFPQEILPYKEFFLAADPSQFGPKLKKAITPIIMDELVPEYVGKNRKKLKQMAAAEVQNAEPGGPRDVIDGLVALYQRAGHDEYGWHMFANLREAEWSYHSFDPPIPAEQKPFDQLVTRYRKVTLPAMMGNWFAPEFDPAKAGWKRGKSPFGQYKGEIPQGAISKCSDACIGPVCYGATKINTLWEKEVLLLRGTFKIPALKKGHRYRLRVNHRAHVGNGGGYGVYINGKLLIEQPSCIGRGGGEKPKGAYITKEFLDDFKGGPVTIAIKSFLRFNDKYKLKPSERIPRGRISLHLEEMKLPPMGDDLFLKSAAVVPMLTSEWQAVQWMEERDIPAGDPRFRYDGQFTANPKVTGSWQTIAQVAAITDFDPTKKTNPGRARIQAITFKNGGSTSDPTWIWSGDRLMDLNKYQALKITVHPISGTDYLFIESGGFSTRNKPGWKSPIMVMKKK